LAAARNAQLKPCVQLSFNRLWHSEAVLVLPVLNANLLVVQRAACPCARGSPIV